MVREREVGYESLRLVAEIPQEIFLHACPLPLVEITRSPIGGSNQVRGSK